VNKNYKQKINKAKDTVVAWLTGIFFLACGYVLIVYVMIPVGSWLYASGKWSFKGAKYGLDKIGLIEIKRLAELKDQAYEYFVEDG